MKLEEINFLNDEDKVKTFSLLNKKRILVNLSHSGALIMTIMVILTPSIIYFVSILPNYFTNALEIIIIYTITLFTFFYCLFALFDVSTTIPGYPPPGRISKEDYDTLEQTTFIKGQTVYLKHCSSCKIIREPRSFHCKICGRCIKRHDHHCGFVVVIHSAVVFTSTIIPFFKTTWNLNQNLWKTNDYFAIFVLIFSGIFFITISGFLIFHLYLTSKNITTNEYLRSGQQTNLFDEGCSKNCSEVFCFK